MEAVAADAARGHLVRQREDLRDFGDGAMEGGVEARDLGHTRHALDCRADRREVVRLVQRRERRQRCEFVNQRRRDEARPVVVLPAMHDAMAECEERSAAQLLAQPRQQRDQRLGRRAGRVGGQVGHGELRAGAVARRDARPHADAVHLARQQQRVILVERELEGG